MRNNSEFKFRTYGPEDDQQLFSLFNKTFRNYAGFVKRTREYWSWYYKSRPDVDENSIIILEDNNQQIVAYAVVGKTGKIWDFCYDSENEKAEEIASLLLEKSVSYLVENGVDEIKFHAPESDKIVRKICREMGFTTNNYRYLFLTVVDFVPLIAKILEQSDQIGFDNELFQIVLTDAPPGIDDSIFVEFGAQSVSVTAKLTRHPKVKIVTSILALTEIIFKKKNLWWSLLKREIKIWPHHNILKGLQFLGKLQLDDVWFTPLGDCY